MIDHVPNGVPGDARDPVWLLQQYLPKLRAFVNQQAGAALRAREGGSDIVQSVCRQVVEQRNRFEFRSEAEFRGWLFRVARNTVREKARRQRHGIRDVGRQVAIPDDDPIAASTSARPSQAAHAAERVTLLEQALDALNPGDREIIALVRIAGLPLREVATLLGKNEAAARKQLGRAVLRLSQELKGRPAGLEDTGARTVIDV